MAHIDQVGVDQQADGDLRVLGAHPGEQLEAAIRGGVAREGAQGRALDGGAVRHRVGEGDAELEGIGAPLDQRIYDGQRQFGGGIPQHHERHEGALIGCV
ncbi:hypothetical protein D3C79_994830 [compost metagenome]